MGHANLSNGTFLWELSLHFEYGICVYNNFVDNDNRFSQAFVITNQKQ